MAKKSSPSRPSSSRAMHLKTYLQRYIPYWGHPGWLEASRWRRFVRNQPVAMICRNTLVENVLSLEWSIRAKDPEDDSAKTKEAVDWHTKLLEQVEGDFDTFAELMLQDMLDLPFGSAAEIMRKGDKPDGCIEWIEHIDAATLYPTLDYEFPVIQRVPEMVGKQVTFPKHAIQRMYVTPRPDIKRKGWGMAPPEKIYLAVEMLYRGDRYYANLLLDTPEAGILDLLDMDEESAIDWLEGFRDLMSGIDGMKVPVLYGHSTPAQWLPLNRPPTDMLYDSTTLKYANLVAAGYGLRLSDLGLGETAGQKTLAGVIRGERQSRKSGHGMVKSKLSNFFNNILPDNIMFIWEDIDEESQVAKGRALQTVGQALKTVMESQILSPEEARMELVATGLLNTDVDPTRMPEQQQPQQPFPFGMPKDEEEDQSGPFAGAPDEKVPPSQGGRGLGFMARSLLGLRGEGEDETPEEAKEAIAPEAQDVRADTPDELVAKMDAIVAPGLRRILDDAEEIRLRRLIKATTRVMVPQVQRTFENLDPYQIREYWLPEMLKMDFGEESELDGVVLRSEQDAIREELEKHLDDDPWWRVASEWDKDKIISILTRAYELGMEQQAINILRSLYEEGLASRPYFGPNIKFNLVNERTIYQLEERAADLVTMVDDGTKFFIKRIIVGGVRQGLTYEKIAEAIREGATAEQVLRDEGFMQDVIRNIMEGMIEMSKTRSKSIALTEIKRAENAGILGQNIRSGLKTKAWVHLGPRGITEAGNKHPCPVCEHNEQLGFVSNDFVFKSVFKKGGVDEEGGILHPPAHPNVCHCRVIFDEGELFDLVSKGEWAPWIGD